MLEDPHMHDLKSSTQTEQTCRTLKKMKKKSSRTHDKS